MENEVIKNKRKFLLSSFFKLPKAHPIPKRVLETVVLSFLTTILILGIVAGITWANRDSLVALILNNNDQLLSMDSNLISSETVSDSILGEVSKESQIEATVTKTNKAVVAIVISKEVPTYETYEWNPFQDFFGGGFGFSVPQYRQNGTEKKQIGGGSGFFVSSDGMIVTNRHVVEDQTAEYTVITTDGKEYSATVLARDSVLDIAILDIDGKDFPFLSLGNSDTLKLGQTVIAIGNALAEFQNTVSVGVISGLSRSIVAGDGMGRSEQLDKVIQTDAAINPGNSGGPLLDLSGRVVGVNVAVAEGSQNVGFSLPINSIKGVIESVKTTGKIVRPYIGIRFTEITSQMKTVNNLPVDYGILVSRGKNQDELAVIPGSPADKAGIVENDIILSVDGKKLDEDANFALIIREKKVGDIVTLRVLSKGVEKIVNVTLLPAPEN